MATPDARVGQIYTWMDTSGHDNLYMVLTVNRRELTTYDWLKVRGNGQEVGSVFIQEQVHLTYATLYVGALTDDEHRLCMLALLDVDAYILEHTR